MPVKWTTCIYDRTDGTPVEQDVTGIHDYESADFQPGRENGQATSTLDLAFVSTESWNIREGQEWAAGWRDTDTRAWSLVDPAGDPDSVYGGYIGVSTGGADGNLHKFSLTLSSYDIDLDTTDIVVWPDLENYPVAYPNGWSAKDYLVGTTANGRPYLGLIPARLGGNGGYLLDGVDDIFDTILFSHELGSTGVKPGVALSDYPLNGGLWGFVDLRSAINDVTSAILAINGQIDPFAYVEAAIDPADPTRIRPRFRLVDRNATDESPVATLASDAGPGEYQIMQPFEHVRAIAGARQRVVVRGDTPFNEPLRYAVGYNAARPVQPTVYQTDPGRSGKPFYSADITSPAMAQQMADELEAYSWGPLGTLKLRVRLALLPGQVVHVRIPQEGIDRNFRIAAVRKVPGVIRYYDITIGTPLPDLNSMLQRRAFRLHALQQLAAAGLPLPTGQTGAPGAARRFPLTSTPQNPTGTENIARAGNANTHALATRTAFQDPSQPVPATPAPQLRSQYQDPLTGEWKDGFSTSNADGRPHPNAIHLGGFTADGTNVPATFAVYQLVITAVDVEGGPGAFTLKKNGTAVAGPFTVGHHVLSPGVTFNPRNGSTAPDILTLDVSGTSSTPTYCVVWEQ